MIEQVFSTLTLFENILWNYLGVPAILFVGLWLSVQSGFVQIRKFPLALKMFFGFFKAHKGKRDGIHPLKAFFAAIGGCIGIGNIVAVCTAVQLGGPGALFWLWLTAILGVMLKYGEVYLGILYRVHDGKGGYMGGPMYFLRKAFRTKWVPLLVAGLLCVYGIEIWQFSIVVHSLSYNFGWNEYVVVFGLLTMVIYACIGGIDRVGTVSSVIIPIFLFIYAGMGLWVLIMNAGALPGMMLDVFTSAFTGHAAVGGFLGSTLMMTVSQGVRRGCYTGDFGVGYASVIHSETFVQSPEKQASLIFIDIFVDAFAVCTTSVMIVLMTGVWKEAIPTEMLIQTALEQYFPYMNIFMPLFLFMLGYSTIIAYFVVGLKSAEYLAPNYGRKVYLVYASIVFLFFSLLDAACAQTVMTIAGGILLVFNSLGIFRLRKHLKYNLDDIAS